MSAEKRTLAAIMVTRVIFREALTDPGALVHMTVWDVEPNAVEDTVARILEYLDKTREKKEPVREDTSKILDIAERYIYQPTDFEEYNKELREKGFKERTPPEAKQGER